MAPRPALGSYMDDATKADQLERLDRRRPSGADRHAMDLGDEHHDEEAPLDAYAEPPEEEDRPAPVRDLTPEPEPLGGDSPPRRPRSGHAAPFELPHGMMLWTGNAKRDERPRLVDGPAFATWPGRVVHQLAPYTEAEAGGMLLTLLTAAGASIGSSPHTYKGNTKHPGRLHVAIVGDTARGRKGTSYETTAPIIEKADPAFFETRIMGGFGSGEAVVDEVADPDEKGEGGSPDKRLLVKEPELTRLLKVANRQGSTLSELIREAWDGGRLQVRSRAKRSVATKAHVCMVGHVVADGLRRHLNDEDTANGFANRLLYCAVGRAQVLPHGAEVPPDIIAEAGRTLGGLVRDARKRGRMVETPEARHAWERFYRRCAEDDTGGLVGAITARAEPQVARLALLFALLDPDATDIGTEHQAAAEAVWDHSVATVRWVWGDRDGDPDADRFLSAVRATGHHGMTSTEQSELFGRNKGRHDLERIRQRLEARGLIATGTVPTGGRPALVSVAVERVQ